jgi:Dyp-type peroxidase family
MALNLNLALPVKANDPELANIQENIIKSTGRNRSLHLFFTVTEAAGARKSIREIANIMNSAADQFSAVAAINASINTSTRLKPKQLANVDRASITLALSHAGYAALNIPQAQRPDDAGFVAGMVTRTLGDDPAMVEPDLNEGIHGVINIAGSVKKASTKRSPLVAAAHKAIKGIISKHRGLKIVFAQAGRGYDNANGEGMEHFGYMDGRSQPTLWEADTKKEARRNGDGAQFVWDPEFPLSQVLVKESGPNAGFGAYFIFRKLEQDVPGFKKAEMSLAKAINAQATALGMNAIPKELAGALLIGRFEDGTPVVDPFGFDTVAPGKSHNDFDYSSDPSGGSCPYFAHIRKTNPRDDNLVPGGRSRTLARRGITYGEREYDLKKKAFMDEDGVADKVGLLFMAFTSSITDKFEVMQQHWANAVNFAPGKNPGIDPIIGQGSGSRNYKFPQGWGGTGTFALVSFAQFVTFRGGEYFFAPSLTFLRAL